MKTFLLPFILFLTASCTAQTRQDTLRGSNGRGRDWWDVRSYGLSITIDTTDKSIEGYVRINAVALGKSSGAIQLDLQDELILDSVEVMWTDRNIGVPHNASRWKMFRRPDWEKIGAAYFLRDSFKTLLVGDDISIDAYYHGKPRIARHPPWDGGFVWSRDDSGRAWVAVACQGRGASSWWPCKDIQSDEPEDGISFDLLYPGQGVRDVNYVSNGMHLPFVNDTMVSTQATSYGSSTTFTVTEAVRRFEIRSPINLYNLTFYLGDYTTFTDTFHGEGGILPLTFHPLRYNEAKARKHFAVVKDMLRCFEWWMGPYPFYEDGYKLVEAPYLGMEHQSAIAYGNKYQMGYLGTDRSGTGIGMLFDYIIIHESGHEWFGNNITAKDVADNWIHEGFTTYTETLYAEWIAGKEKAARYNKGEWRGIENDRPIIGAYGVNDDGSGDKYDKGTAILHMIRTVVADDETFRQILRGLNRDFWHQTVTTKQVEDYISQKSGYDFSAFFNQYLRTTQIPKLEWYRKGKRIHYRFTNVVSGFSLPVAVDGFGNKVVVSEAWSSTELQRGVEWEDNFLMKVDKVNKRAEF